ncbi:MAG: S9 family peptidase [Spirosomataceae bacterium]
MKKHLNLFVTLMLGLGLFSCKNDSKTEMTTPKTQDDFPKPPVAEIIPQEFSEHGNKRIDNYYWLRDKENPKVIEYIKAENAYCDTAMAHTKAFQDKLFAEMKGRIKEEDQSVPYLENGYYYYSRTETGKQYGINCRKKGNLEAKEEVLIDGNKMAEGKNAFINAGFEVSPDNKLMAYLHNFTGSYAEFTLKFKDLTTGKDLPDVLDKCDGFTWANDNKTVFYVVPNKSLRPYRIYKHVLGSKKDELIYEEKDERFSCGVGKTKTGDFLFIYSGSTTTTEMQYLSANEPNGKFKVFLPRVKDVDYSVDHHKNKFFIKWKDNENKNSKIYEAPLTGFEDKSTWKEVIKHDPKVKIEGIEVFEKFLALSVRTNGLREIRIMNLADNKISSVNFPEPVYNVSKGYNPEYNATTVRYTYQSLNRPRTTYEYDMATAKSVKLKEQEIPSGFDAEKYEVKRLFATAKDGVKVPMAIVYKKGLDFNGKNPALLYAYGSYGVNTDANFDANVFSLVDRGFVYGIAQIRGGSEMGEEWYEDGKLMKKMNTFTDFIACAEQLIKDKYTSSEYLAVNGGSAGGLLMGAITNLRPDLFKVVVAEVPFVDVMNTMLDTSLPLTTQEYEEWGNPNEKEAYQYMMSYSPYDNLKKGNYPNILATGGLNDSQVGFHEPTKWVAKLRTLKTDKNLLLLKINMDSGHGGATGRFDYLKEEAFRYAFIMDRIGVKY